MEHIPVLQQEVLELLQGCTYVIDATFGRGGHTKALLQHGCRVVAVDRDEQAILSAQTVQQNDATGQFSYIHARFSEIDYSQANGVLFDFGLSTPQIRSDRGFSFEHDSILDMGMGLNNTSALDILNTYSERALADIFFQLADESMAKVYARRIIQLRKLGQIRYMSQLLSIFPQRTYQRIHPATKVLQALRMEVNDELSEIDTALTKATTVSGLKIVCISFHSGEDRLVKQHFKRFTQKSKKPIIPSEREIQNNPASRSAKLRWCIVD